MPGILDCVTGARTLLQCDFNLLSATGTSRSNGALNAPDVYIPPSKERSFLCTANHKTIPKNGPVHRLGGEPMAYPSKIRVVSTLFLYGIQQDRKGSNAD
ncbi:hypothetical protein TNCV_652141 [Trichonephila clavipes]|nr:hypothetical protein TNCV_652141 [Trichonephila clavipes]